jgi:hypothetical protein
MSIMGVNLFQEPRAMACDLLTLIRATVKEAEGI